MSHGIFSAPPPVNDPVRPYEPGSAARAALQAELKRQHAERVEVAAVIDGERVTTGNTVPLVAPHARNHTLGTAHLASPELVGRAIESSLRAKASWSELPWDARVAVFLRAAALAEGPWRDRLNASTMLGQSKTAHQAEIDAACELIDFWRFNARFYEDILREQPPVSPSDMWNRTEYRPLDGFVFAVSPFNFTSIAANLPTAPALCGNVVLWKPATTALLSAQVVLDLLTEAGLPPGVINMLPGAGADVGEPVMRSPDLGGLHFTGSTRTFQTLWGQIGANISNYRQYPRIVGETGGKDFVLVHPSADLEAVSVALLRGAFEYQGQKCSAASRAYVPRSLWPQLRERLGAMLADVQIGDVTDFRNFMGAVIDAKSYAKLTGAIEQARSNVGTSVTEVLGGEADDSQGWLIRPTVIVASDPNYRTMTEELFGPVLTILVYDDAAWSETIKLVDGTSPYALTGAVFANDRYAVQQAVDGLRYAAGNFYINDKPTGAVVGQQPFGGSRASGTNDKAGSPANLHRWLSARSIKETFNPPKSWRYPFMAGA